MNNYAPWTISPDDWPASGSLGDQIKFVCSYGLLAPSAHNTQPWGLSVKGDGVVVGINEDRRLTASDMTGRQTWLSLGCCIENIVLAGAACGLTVKVELDEADEVIRLNFKPSRQVAVNGDQLLAMSQRCSNRNPYQNRPVSAKLLAEIERTNQDESVLIKATTDPNLIALVADSTAKGVKMAMSLPTFKAELAHLLRPNWTTQPDGMPGFVFNMGPLKSWLAPWLFRYGSIAEAESARDRKLLMVSGGLILGFSRGDTLPFWWQAGRAYQRAAVAATRLGLATATMAAAVEAPDFHQDIETMAGTDWRLQTVMRIGYADRPARHSPRRSLADVVPRS